MCPLIKEACLSVQLSTVSPIAKDGSLISNLITEDYDAATWVAAVVDLSDILKSINDSIFEVMQRRDFYEVVVRRKYQQLGRWLISVMANAPSFIKKHFPYHDFNPRVAVFFEKLLAYPRLKPWLDKRYVFITRQDAVEVCQELNQFVEVFRVEISSHSFMVQTKRAKRSALKNFKVTRRYVNDLFALRSRLLVVRVDLYYPSEHAMRQDSGRQVSIEKVVSDRRRFLKALHQQGFSENLLGYCWKLEYALKKGFHYHCIFFFDGAKVREGVTLGRLVGQLWERVSGNLQVYWNCNSAEYKYAFPGIGMISYADHQRRMGLERAIAYLTKPDYWLCLSKKKVGDVFGRSKIKVTSKNAGRPRVPRMV